MDDHPVVLQSLCQQVLVSLTASVHIVLVFLVSMSNTSMNAYYSDDHPLCSRGGEDFLLCLSSMFSIHSTAQRRWFRRVHVTMPGAIIEHNNRLPLSHPRIVPILSGAIEASSSNLTISSSEMLRGGFSGFQGKEAGSCLLYTSPSPRDKRQSRMPSSA